MDSLKQWSPLNPYIRHSSTFTFSGHYHNIYLSRKQDTGKMTLSRQFLTQITQPHCKKTGLTWDIPCWETVGGWWHHEDRVFHSVGARTARKGGWILWILQQLDLSQDTSAAWRSRTRGQSNSHIRKKMGSRGITAVLYRLKMGQCSPIILFTNRWIEFLEAIEHFEKGQLFTLKLE